MPSRSSPIVGRALACRWAPCSNGRCQYAPTPLVILLIVGVDYVATILFSISRGTNAGVVLMVITFHFFLGLTIVAWVYTCAVDPGVPPESWQREMASLASSGEAVLVCRRSGLYKPPRSHFDSVTHRLTLNMDHFCPWVNLSSSYIRAVERRGSQVNSSAALAELRCSH